jgi:hypothetical protein
MIWWIWKWPNKIIHEFVQCENLLISELSTVHTLSRRLVTTPSGGTAFNGKHRPVSSGQISWEINFSFCAEGMALPTKCFIHCQIQIELCCWFRSQSVWISSTWVASQVTWFVAISVENRSRQLRHVKSINAFGKYQHSSYRFIPVLRVSSSHFLHM